MEGFGPVDGNPIDTGLLIVGSDPVATDCVVSEIMGFKPRSVPHLKFAIKKGLLSDKIEIVRNGDFNDPPKFEFVSSNSYRASRLALRIQRFSILLANFASLIEKVRSASSSVGISYVRKRVDYNFAFKNIKSWIYKKNG